MLIKVPPYILSVFHLELMNMNWYVKFTENDKYIWYCGRKKMYYTLGERSIDDDMYKYPKFHNWMRTLAQKKISRLIN